mmetsp:Transcript_8547/g.26506  ORF Transcript_8547/g.26506 Transcript_8547/m.26506 type:complete len:803 (-) Transcript_8547:12-2420(-)
MTSGGDAQGMNAAVRAVVRMAMAQGVTVYGVEGGYSGLVFDRLRLLKWADVGGVLQKGGTFLGTTRCQEFRTKEGRFQAAVNMLKAGVDTLVVIGGDGSLTGAHILKTEWNDHVQAAIGMATKNKDQVLLRAATTKNVLTVVGMVGSIDNDFTGAEMTIGADTALTRIVDSVDCLASTADSHRRDFIVEVMGRNCGWLALMGACATGADWLFIPEFPVPDDWKQQLCGTLTGSYKVGRTYNIVILAEGARDRSGKPVTSTMVKDALAEAGLDSRITILGHVQRGGSPRAFDRIMSTMLGAKAVEVAIDPENRNKSLVVVLTENNTIEALSLTECVRRTQNVAKLIEDHKYDEAVKERGAVFEELWQFYMRTHLPTAPKQTVSRGRIGIMHAGAVSPGMNTAVRALTRSLLERGYEPMAINSGLDGLVCGERLTPLTWTDVANWSYLGGALLSTRRGVAFEQGSQSVTRAAILECIANTVASAKLKGMVVVGGWDGYLAMLQLNKRRHKFPALAKLPIILVPASISNNLPGTDFSVGSDTALNAIVSSVDKIKQSAMATRRCFVVEVMGSCGYLARFGGIATGAEKCYLDENPIDLVSLNQDLYEVSRGFESYRKMAVVLRSERSNKVFSTKFLAELYADYSQGAYDVRTAQLGHLQQGGSPSPMDRILAIRLCQYVVDFFDKVQSQFETGVLVCCGVREGKVVFTPAEKMETSMTRHRRPIDQWWMHWGTIAEVLERSSPRPDGDDDQSSTSSDAAEQAPTSACCSKANASSAARKGPIANLTGSRLKRSVSALTILAKGDH